MAWTPLSSRLSGLPKVLAGPILRRVEKDSASVWIACRQDFTVQLFVGPALGPANQKLDIKLGLNQLNSSPPLAQAVKLGTNLYVALASATPAQHFSASKIYQYSLRFVFGTQTLWLDEATVLSNAGGLGSISYPAFAGPTFLVTPSLTNELKFAHVSCRKPHGGDVDALAALHEVLKTTHADVAKRPRQLFHTGDQIYADDVHPTLLCMVRDASKALLDWPIKEKAPVILDEDAAEVANDPRRPGNRQKTVTEAKLTTTEGANHLLYLGEFYAMYLFAWSDTLWPDLAPTKPYSALFPQFSTVFPGPRPIQQDIFFAGPMGPVGPIVPPASLEQAAYENDLKPLTRFRKDLPNVRKALANIASYMMFDDHDVTDDWFLTKDWCTATLTEPSLARRMMQNALSAFAVFQAWGNTPALFRAPLPGSLILSKLAALAGTQPADWTSLGTALLPSLNSNGDLTGGFDWHFNIEFGTYTLFMLDTRTHRGFDNGWEPARLINAAHLAQQIPTLFTANYAIVVSPAPVVGYLPVERALQFGADLSEAAGNLPMPIVSHGGVTKKPRRLLDSQPLPSIKVAPPLMMASPINPWLMHLALKLFEYMEAGRLAVVEEILRRRKHLRQSTLGELDFEAWGYHPGAFQDLLKQMSQYPRVIILSGDVHYAFSNKIEYWNDRNAPGTTQPLNSYSIFIQFCSSAARNAAGLTRGVDLQASCSLLSGPPPEYQGFGWETANGDWHVEEDILPDPHIRLPDWQYRIRYAADGRGNPARNLPNPPPMPLTLDPLGISLFQRAVLWLGQRVVVGTDNIGTVEFVKPQNEEVAAQDFHWSLVGPDPYDAPDCMSHTRHELVLNPAATPPRPWS